MRSVLVFAALALAAALSVPRYAAQMQPAKPVAAKLQPRPQPQAEAATYGSRSVIVPRDNRGNFQVEGRVDGQPMAFVVDTGATVVALTASDAAMLGIHPAEREFTAMTRTANGTVRAAPVQLGMVEIGDLMIRDIDAIVLPDGALSDNLLGLSFLSRLRHFEYGDGKLVLEE